MSTPASDERLGLPSGSGAYRWLNCPGSHLAQKGIPDEQSADAAEGELLHAILAGKREPIDITEEQSAVVMFAMHQRERLTHDLLGEDAEIVDKDQTRYWLRDRMLDMVGSCMLDFIARAGSKMLVIDYKFGRNEVDPADTNAQLRFAAAIIRQECRASELFVAIIAPRADGERVTVASFDDTAMTAAFEEMTAGAMRAMKPNQPRNPSAKACHYCRARGTSSCPESIAVATSLATVTLGQLASPEEMAVLLEKCELADRVIDTIRNGAKMRLAAGVEIPGWRLKPGNTIKKIGDPIAAWAKIGQQIGGSAFAECCTVSLPELSRVYKKQFSKKSEKDARAEVEALLIEAGALTEKQNAPSLAREIST